jgi:hypothetical protein
MASPARDKMLLSNSRRIKAGTVRTPPRYRTRYRTYPSSERRLGKTALAGAPSVSILKCHGNLEHRRSANRVGYTTRGRRSVTLQIRRPPR